MAEIGTTSAKKGLHSGKSIDGKFLVGKLLCQDALGGLYQCTDEEGEEFAIKLFSGGITISQLASNSPLHPNILSPHAISKPNKLPRYAVFESNVHVTLREWMKHRLQATPDNLISVMLQLTSAIHAIHALGRPVGNLCPETIFIGEDFMGMLEVYVLDANIQFSSRTTTQQLYQPPEQLLEYQVSPATDIWSIGAIIYEALFKRKAYQGTTRDEIIQQVTTQKPKFTTYSKVPADLVGIIQKCLQLDAENRYENMTILGGDLLLVQENVGKTVVGEAVQKAITESIVPATRISFAPPPSPSAKQTSISPESSVSAKRASRFVHAAYKQKSLPQQKEVPKAAATSKIKPVPPHRDSSRSPSENKHLSIHPRPPQRGKRPSKKPSTTTESSRPHRTRLTRPMAVPGTQATQAPPDVAVATSSKIRKLHSSVTPSLKAAQSTSFEKTNVSSMPPAANNVFNRQESHDDTPGASTKNVSRLPSPKSTTGGRILGDISTSEIILEESIEPPASPKVTIKELQRQEPSSDAPIHKRQLHSPVMLRTRARVNELKGRIRNPKNRRGLIIAILTFLIICIGIAVAFGNRSSSKQSKSVSSTKSGQHIKTAVGHENDSRYPSKSVPTQTKHARGANQAIGKTKTPSTDAKVTSNLEEDSDSANEISKQQPAQPHDGPLNTTAKQSRTNSDAAKRTHRTQKSAPKARGTSKKTARKSKKAKGSSNAGWASNPFGD